MRLNISNSESNVSKPSLTGGLDVEKIGKTESHSEKPQEQELREDGQKYGPKFRETAGKKWTIGWMKEIADNVYQHCKVTDYPFQGRAFTLQHGDERARKFYSSFYKLLPKRQAVIAQLIANFQRVAGEDVRFSADDIEEITARVREPKGRGDFRYVLTTLKPEYYFEFNSKYVEAEKKWSVKGMTKIIENVYAYCDKNNLLFNSYAFRNNWGDKNAKNFCNKFYHGMIKDRVRQEIEAGLNNGTDKYHDLSAEERRTLLEKIANLQGESDMEYLIAALTPKLAKKFSRKTVFYNRKNLWTLDRAVEVFITEHENFKSDRKDKFNQEYLTGNAGEGKNLVYKAAKRAKSILKMKKMPPVKNLHDLMSAILQYKSDQLEIDTREKLVQALADFEVAEQVKWDVETFARHFVTEHEAYQKNGNEPTFNRNFIILGNRKGAKLALSPKEKAKSILGWHSVPKKFDLKKLIEQIWLNCRQDIPLELRENYQIAMNSFEVQTQNQWTIARVVHDFVREYEYFIEYKPKQKFYPRNIINRGKFASQLAGNVKRIAATVVGEEYLKDDFDLRALMECILENFSDQIPENCEEKLEEALDYLHDTRWTVRRLVVEFVKKYKLYQQRKQTEEVSFNANFINSYTDSGTHMAGKVGACAKSVLNLTRAPKRMNLKELVAIVLKEKNDEIPNKLKETFTQAVKEFEYENHEEWTIDRAVNMFLVGYHKYLKEVPDTAFNAEYFARSGQGLQALSYCVANNRAQRLLVHDSIREKTTLRDFIVKLTSNEKYHLREDIKEELKEALKIFEYRENTQWSLCKFAEGLVDDYRQYKRQADQSEMFSAKYLMNHDTKTGSVASSPNMYAKSILDKEKKKKKMGLTEMVRLIAKKRLNDLPEDKRQDFVEAAYALSLGCKISQKQGLLFQYGFECVLKLIGANESVKIEPLCRLQSAGKGRNLYPDVMVEKSADEKLLEKTIFELKLQNFNAHYSRDSKNYPPILSDESQPIKKSLIFVSLNGETSDDIAGVDSYPDVEIKYWNALTLIKCMLKNDINADILRYFSGRERALDGEEKLAIVEIYKMLHKLQILVAKNYQDGKNQLSAAAVHVAYGDVLKEIKYLARSGTKEEIQESSVWQGLDKLI